MFLLAEAVKSLKRAKFATMISVITIIFASFLCTTAVWLYLSAGKINKIIAEKIEVRIFLKDGIGKDKLSVFKNELSKSNIVSRVKYVSKEEAAKEVSKALGIAIKEVINNNPLPNAFVVNFVNIDSDKTIRDFVKETENKSIVSDVVYEKLLLAKLNKYLPFIKYIIFALAVLFVFIAFYMIIVVNRMAIENNSKNYEIMKLIGANLRTIRMPIILNGFLIATIAMILSTPILYLFYKFTYSILLLEKFEFDMKISIIAFIIFAFVFGIVGSIYSSRKISLRFKY